MTLEDAFAEWADESLAIAEAMFALSAESIRSNV